MGDEELRHASVLGRLLAEVSWEGARVRGYRKGGRGQENVLTADVLMPLDFLPRERFLGAVVRAAHGADAARALLARGLEDAKITMLPAETMLRPNGDPAGKGIVVQPDAYLDTEDCHVLVEAKRLRSSGFQPEQLAREFLAVQWDAGSRTPLMLLVLGSRPPVLLRSLGRMSIERAIESHVDTVLHKLGRAPLPADTLAQRVSEICAWITWDELKEVVGAQAVEPHTDDPSIQRSIRRLADAVTTAVDWHR